MCSQCGHCTRLVPSFEPAYPITTLPPTYQGEESSNESFKTGDGKVFSAFLKLRKYGKRAGSQQKKEDSYHLRTVKAR